jgi:hypothetical protein
METFMNDTFTRIACALALSVTAGCADFYASSVETSEIPILVKDIGSECETDDPVDTEIARVHVEQRGDMCVIEAAALVQAIEYADLEDDFDGIDLEGDNVYWEAGGICWRQADESDVDQAYEKCDYGPSVRADWRLAGEEAWSANSDFPNDATADLDISYYPGPMGTLDDVGGATPALFFSTNGDDFPGGPVTFAHNEFFDPFQEAAADQADLYSAVHAHVEVPMSVISEFTEHEYRISFAYQTYVQVAVTEQSFWEMVFGGWLGND